MARIIISDDDMVSLLVLKNLVDFLGHESIACRNGAEAVEEFKKQAADLVILDINMPVMNGREACKEIRQLPKGGTVPIIIVSGLDDEEDVIEGLNAGANDYLLKPVKDSHLLAKLKVFLRMSSLHNNDFELAKKHAVFAGRYKILKLLGYGAHSVVFLTEDISSGNQKTALKLFKESPEVNEIYDSFASTAAKLKKIDCSYLLKTIDYGQSDNRLFIAMEHAEKGDISKILKSRTFSQKEALKLAIHIANAIKAIAAMGIVHFDIKPQNIMLGSDDKFLLADFGVVSTRSNLTISIKKEVWGTAAYMPPEYLSGEEIFPGTSDIYSLGITLYEALTGANPFFSERIVNSMINQLNLNPPALLSVDERFNPEISAIVDVMLSKVPDKRPLPDEIISKLSEILVDIEQNPEKDFCLYVHKEAAEKNAEEKSPADKEESSNTSFDEPQKYKVKKSDFFKYTPKKNKQSIFSNNFLSGAFDIFSSAIPSFELSLPSISLPTVRKIIKLSLVVLIVVFAIFAIQKLYAYISQPEEQDASSVVLSVIKCAKCEYTIEKHILDIADEKCPSCSSQMSTALECADCGAIFPFVEGSLNTNGKNFSPYTCPKCKSENTAPVQTSDEYLQRKAIKRN